MGNGETGMGVGETGTGVGDAVGAGVNVGNGVGSRLPGTCVLVAVGAGGDVLVGVGVGVMVGGVFWTGIRSMAASAVPMTVNPSSVWPV